MDGCETNCQTNWTNTKCFFSWFHHGNGSTEGPIEAESQRQNAVRMETHPEMLEKTSSDCKKWDSNGFIRDWMRIEWEEIYVFCNFNLTRKVTTHPHRWVLPPWGMQAESQTFSTPSWDLSKVSWMALTLRLQSLKHMPKWAKQPRVYGPKIPDDPPDCAGRVWQGPWKAWRSIYLQARPAC